ATVRPCGRRECKDVLREYRAGGRALCRPLTLGLTPIALPRRPRLWARQTRAKLASRSAYGQFFPRVTPGGPSIRSACRPVSLRYKLVRIVRLLVSMRLLPVGQPHLL